MTSNSHRESIMSLHNLIANGGKVVVVGGYHKDWESYREHPQLEFWSGDNSFEIATTIKQHGDSLPDNTRAVIISRFLSHAQLKKVMIDARKKRLTIFPNKNTGEISKLLTDIITPPPANGSDVESSVTKEKKVIAGRGVIKALVEQHDTPSISITESAKVLFDIAKEKSISTTLNSLAQGISVYRRKKGLSASSPSVKKIVESPITTLIRTFDDAIAGLQLCREQLANISTENEELRNYKNSMEDRIKSLLSPK